MAGVSILGLEKLLPFILLGFLRRKCANLAAPNFLRVLCDYHHFKDLQGLKLRLGEKQGALSGGPEPSLASGPVESQVLPVDSAGAGPLDAEVL